MGRYVCVTYGWIGNTPELKKNSNNYGEVKAAHDGTGAYSSIVYDTQDKKIVDAKSPAGFLDISRYNGNPLSVMQSNDALKPLIEFAQRC